MCGAICPAGSAATGAAGKGSAPRDTAGSTFSTLGDGLWMALNGGVELKDNEICMTHGPVVTIINGNKHKHTIGIDEAVHLGASFQEIGAWDSKFAGGGDIRDITAARWEWNVGIKAESVFGDANEHLMAKQQIDIPGTTTETNPTKETQKCPEREQKCQEIVEKFKARMVDSRKALTWAITDATRTFKDYTRDYKTYEQQIEKYSAQFHEYCGKINNLKEQARKYKIETDKFFKTLASAGISLKAAKIKGSAKKKVVFVAKALAEFKGDIKAG